VIEKKVKSLKRMGYAVLVNKRYGFIQICLQADTGYGAYLSVNFDEMERDFIVEEIVKKFNDAVIGYIEVIENKIKEL